MSKLLLARKLLVTFLATACLETLSVAHAAPSVTAMTASSPSPQPVGATITWTATANDTDAGILAYRFSTKAPSASAGAVVRDYHSSNTFAWTPSETEGSYVVQVTVQNLVTKKLSSMAIRYQVSPRATAATGPVLTRTAHPLVALYSSPPCPAGSTIFVTFTPSVSAAPTKSTNRKACTGNTSVNFYIAGMRPNTRYLMVQTTVTGGSSTAGPNMYFTTGTIPPDIAAIIPAATVVRPVGPLTSKADNMILMDYMPAGTLLRIPTLMDFAGRTLWYYPALSPQYSRFFVRPVAGGSMLVFVEDPSITTPNSLFQSSQILREFDLAGNTTLETNVTAVAAQLTAKYPRWNVCNWPSVTGCAAGQTAVLDFHHDALRLPNGNTAVLLSAEKVFTNGVQGSSPANPVNILGDMVVVLDTNLQVIWAWNGYWQQDLNRAAVLNETCTSSGTACPPFNFTQVANDWLHSNSLHYNTADGSILLSQRNQDFVIKLNYAAGTGDGHIVWRLGKGGDFTMTGTGDAYPWFSHQHNAGWDVDGQPLLSLFDNGNTRVAPPPVGLGPGNSRGMVLNVDETNMTASPFLLADLGNYSFAVGSAQRLSDASGYSFGSGIVTSGLNVYAQSIEVVAVPAPTGTLDFTLQGASSAYRAYRLSSLYSGLSK